MNELNSYVINLLPIITACFGVLLIVILSLLACFDSHDEHKKKIKKTIFHKKLMK